MFLTAMRNMFLKWGCLNWSLTFNEEHGLRSPRTLGGDRCLGVISGKYLGGWRKLF